MTDRLIRRFTLEGTFTDNVYLMVKDSATRELAGQMRDEGWVPVLDLDPWWSTAFDGQTYQYKLTMQGIYVGEDAWHYRGVTNGRLVPSSPKTN